MMHVQTGVGEVPPGLRRVSRLLIAVSLLATVRLEKPTSWFKRQGSFRLRAT